MSGVEFALLYLGWMLAGSSAGPATLSIAGTSMNEGRKAGLIFALGILAGSASLGLAAASGLSAVMLANAWVFEILRYFGAVYLLYLALKSLRAALKPGAALLLRSHRGTPAQVFSRGLLIHLTNPKAILTWGSIYAIVLPVDATAGDVFRMFFILYAGSIIIFLGYALLFSNPGIVRGYQRMKRFFDFTFAVFFGAASLKLLTVPIRQ
ncbi:MAG: threonine efflux protein [Paracoccaceae bacterium]|jgi:threonine efflux protein